MSVVRFTIISGDAYLTVEVKGSVLPNIHHGKHCFVIRPIESYRIIDEKSSHGYEDCFTVCLGYDKGLVIENDSWNNSFFMSLPEVVEK